MVRLIKLLITVYLLHEICHTYDVKIGLLMPHDEIGFVKYMYGFSTSAGAVTLALDRVKEEKLLPDANFSIAWRFDQCDESTAAGASIELFVSEKVDVVIGPPCSVPAAIVAVMAKYYNIPMVSWAATALDTTEVERLPTLSRVIGSAYRIGRALKEILDYFKWTRIALFYTDDKTTRKCYSVAQGVMKHLPRSGIQIVVNHEIDGDRPTDEEIDRFLDIFPTLTRIVLVCIDRDEDNRRFTLRAKERGFGGEEFVYIIPDYVRDENKTDVWTDRQSLGDNMDFEARRSMENVMFVEMLLSSDGSLWKMKQEIPKRIKHWPFYFDSDLKNDQYGSLYSPFLYDAVYMYALALNHTLEDGGNITDGIAITNHTRNMQFHGMSGHVIIDDLAGREPSFVLKGFNKDGKQITFLLAEMYKPEGQVSDSKADKKTITMMVSEEVMWENRGGYVPQWYPKCGWYGELCIDTSISSKKKSLLPWIIIAACAGSVVLLVALIGAIIYYKRKLAADEMAMMLWKIKPSEIHKLVDMVHDGSATTVSTEISEDVADIVLKGDERCACCRGQLVWLKSHNSSMVLSSKEDHVHLKILREILHDNLNVFVGLVLEGSSPVSVWRFNSKGSLQDILLNSSIKIDWFFKYSLIRDLANGIECLHESPLKSHGHLKSTNCVISNRWVLKITDFGLPQLMGRQHDSQVINRLWTSPELLRMENPPGEGTMSGDVYSFAVILQEIITRDTPFGSFNKLPNELVNLVRAGLNPPFRPELPNVNAADVDPGMVTLMKDCWVEDPKLRPDIKHIKGALKQMGRGKEGSLLDHALKMMEKYSNCLENTITDRTRQLTEETKKADILLYKFMPRPVADRLKMGCSVEPEAYDSATIFFSSISDFDTIASKSSPLQLCSLLNDIYYQLDEILDDYDAFKIQTVNDMYLIATGLKTGKDQEIPPNKRLIAPNAASISKMHVAVAANLALHYQLSMSNYIIPHMPKEKVQLKIGIHTGPVVTGIIGTLAPHYCVFGDTVNVACKLLEYGKASCIHISESSNSYLTEVIGGYITKPRGEVQVKGSGTFFTFWLLGKKSKSIEDKTNLSAGTEDTHTKSFNSHGSDKDKDKERRD